MKQMVVPGAVVITFAAFALLARAQSRGLVVHEWGTFTSFQDSGGNLLEWKPLETAKLPGFVHDWANDNLDRRSRNPILTFGKGSVAALQRMETPVIYFYSDREQTVDVSVHFPEGFITEWFPQANQIGPSFVPTNALPSSKALTSPDSVIHWPSVRVVAGKTGSSDLGPLPTDQSGSHYFAARETDANTLVVPGPDWTKPAAEQEKFLFYRGVARFATPLHVAMSANDKVTISNTGTEPLKNLFVLDVNDAKGAYTFVQELPAGGKATITLKSSDQALPLKQLEEHISRELASSLAGTGLFPREADAMVNTWKDSWFQEPGVRVLYVLPRVWTDHTLPLAINPAPDNVVRTMVGRAEIMPPAVEKALSYDIERMRNNDAQAPGDIRRVLKNLGRFSDAALSHAMGAAALPADENVKLLSQINGSASEALTSRIVATTTTFPAGRAIPLKLEIQNVATMAKEFRSPTAQYNDAFVVLDAQGKEATYIGGWVQAMAGETKMLDANGSMRFGDFDLAKYYYLRTPGHYTVKWQGQTESRGAAAAIPGDNLSDVAASPEVAFDIVADPAGTADGDPVGRLLTALKAKWWLAVPNDQAVLQHPGGNRAEVPARSFVFEFNPTGYKMDLGTISIWLADVPAAEQTPVDNNHAASEYLGKLSYWQVYMSEDANAPRTWPTAREDIRRALSAGNMAAAPQR